MTREKLIEIIATLQLIDMEVSVISIDGQGPIEEQKRKTSIDLIRRELFKVGRIVSEEVIR